MIKRNIENQVLKTINDYKKMAFLSGPQQDGKTTMSLEIKSQFEQVILFSLNW